MYIPESLKNLYVNVHTIIYKSKNKSPKYPLKDGQTKYATSIQISNTHLQSTGRYYNMHETWKHTKRRQAAWKGYLVTVYDSISAIILE